MWLGGVASLAVILITAMAYNFAMSYLNQYPAEKVGPSSFACDETIRNAKFESTLKALAVPVSEVEKPIFAALKAQTFTVQLDFLSTSFPCQALSIMEVLDSSTLPLRNSSCTSGSGKTSISVVLPQHVITVRAVINDIQPIGGVRVSLSGPGQDKDSYSLQELNFSEPIFSDSAGTLAQQATIQLALTKVINETAPLSEGESEFGGIWYPTFTWSASEMFVDAAQYLTSANLSSTTLTLVISETSYYIKNVQSPIAKQPEVVFRTLLFSFLCLEICALVFVIFKLIIMPVIHRIQMKMQHKGKSAIEPDLMMKQSSDE